MRKMQRERNLSDMLESKEIDEETDRRYVLRPKLSCAQPYRIKGTVPNIVRLSRFIPSDFTVQKAHKKETDIITTRFYLRKEIPVSSTKLQLAYSLNPLYLIKLLKRMLATRLTSSQQYLLLQKQPPRPFSNDAQMLEANRLSNDHYLPGIDVPCLFSINSRIDNPVNGVRITWR